MSDNPSIPPTPDDPQPTAAVASPDAVQVPSIVGAPAEPDRIPAPFHIVSESEDNAERRAQVAAARHRTPAEKTESAKSDGRTDQASLLVMVPIKAGHCAALQALLQKVANPDDGYDFEVNCIIPFAKIRTLHFARILLHEASPTADNPLPTYPPPPARGKVQVKGPPIPPKMLFATDFDGPLDEHVDELLAVAGDGLDQVFSHCEGWPGSADRAAVHGYFLRHRIESNTFYTGTMHRSVDQIHREEELHQAIENYLDREAQKPGFPTEPVRIREKIRDFVFNDEHLAWARLQPGPFPKLLFNPSYLKQVAIGVVLAILAVLTVVLRLTLGSWSTALKVTGGVVAVAVVLLVAAYLFLRKLEKTDPVIILNKDIDDLVSVEDRIVQNQMSSVIYIKEPLWFRGLVLRAVLAFINFSAKYLSNQGTLAGIPSIHFARWVIVDNGRRLVFFSNFDGSWENYLGDFIDKSHSGLTGVWSNCVGFPRTKNLIQEGATDEQKFKAYSRDSQIPTQVWYSAYRWLSVDNINNNSKIRLGLYGDMTADQAALWVRRFGGSTNVDNTGAELPKKKAAAKPAPAVELEDVQGLVARSFNGLKHGKYVLVYLPQDAAAARAWVGEMAEVVTRGDLRSGEVKEQGVARSLGFTREGLERLGLDDETIRTFSTEFRDGMTTQYKQRVMGDDGPSAPRNWAWGRADNPVHAMIFAFAGDEARLQRVVDEERVRAERHGVTLGTALPSVMLSEDKEHFGFHDGIAQPRVQGFRKPDDGEAPSPTEASIPPGEVVLGYTNAYGQIPDSPTVPDTPGARAVLPRAPVDPDDAPGTPVRMDLGKNGSYVVFRQLEQHVKAFWSFLDAQARHDAEARKKLGAKMVGRWPNGAPLVLHPDQEPPTFDRATANAFLYSGKYDDIRGDKCPLGSHIRRTNPRDGMQPGPEGSLLVADRHRLLRRGRAYGEPVAPSFDPAEIIASDKPDTGRGLHFICFNTDLGRQFEFVQSTWVNSMKFDGLYRDADPLIGPHVNAGDPGVYPEQVTAFTEQRCPVRHQTHNVPRFVTTIGGAYFFMPGMRALRYLARLD
jgi:Dyp-type peroxidase family